MNYLTLALWAALVLSATAANAEVYKWTDAQGNTHYGDRQPEGIKSKSMNIRSGNPDDPVRMAPERTAQPAPEGESNSSQNGLDPEQDRKNCEVARENLQVLTNNSRVQIEEAGTRRYLTPEEIEAKRAELEQLVQTRCAT
ncbi:DUF4124 domain-containing protein [Hydrocarboniclastica marina]|uniref:DUF4124 domain-containing protein n=1 Tax=Hydrocarboniclastica marina TaxID=2259620 RepID=A0A4P7XEX5_9ALTE|nr:DUF4124 domain-containing protein [Hydrocarboniclastica marina]MAL99466.1 DUF4124 domain-containing protein [Alteromonadaceae bacterium]QCF25113.1 DUF4124 domain-containing protein [Hydrocarboniclastica marina]|tara:strand:+ start:1732 stop:2154 length:423 start_codon:yes stop_codon:yes gene_type:complete